MVVADKIRRAWADCREALDYCALGRREQEALAWDVGVSLGTLDRVVELGSGASRELPRLLQAVSLDYQVVARSHALTLRGMDITCSDCTASKQCELTLSGAPLT
jgi:hypothetical protein